MDKEATFNNIMIYFPSKFELVNNLENAKEKDGIPCYTETNLNKNTGYINKEIQNIFYRSIKKFQFNIKGSSQEIIRSKVSDDIFEPDFKTIHKCLNNNINVIFNKFLFCSNLFIRGIRYNIGDILFLYFLRNNIRRNITNKNNSDIINFVTYFCNFVNSRSETYTIKQNILDNLIELEISLPASKKAKFFIFDTYFKNPILSNVTYLETRKGKEYVDGNLSYLPFDEIIENII